MRSMHVHHLTRILAVVLGIMLVCGLSTGCKKSTGVKVVSSGVSEPSSDTDMSTQGVNVPALDVNVTSTFKVGPDTTKKTSSKPYPIKKGRIVFIRNRDIYLYDPKNGSITRLTKSGRVTDVCVRRDGSTIGYVDDGRPDPHRGECTIETIKEDGSDRKTITSVPLEGDSAILSISLSPNKELIYYSDCANCGYSERINRLDLKTGKEKGMKESKEGQSVNESRAYAAFSPDGKKLAYIHFIWGSEYDNDIGKLAIINSDGSGSRDIVDLGKGYGPANCQPAWSFDGSKLAYIGHDGQVWIAGMDGSNPTKLTNMDGQCNGPDWSPDGRLIIFNTYTYDDPKKEILFSVPVTSGLPSRILQGSHDSHGRFIQ